jgi:2-oxo-4-hydroxy-4-carboxy-5-ureidoimidazoline decarboxylase
MLDSFNTAPDDDRLRAALRACCAAQSWIDRIVAGRPYADETALDAVSDAATGTLDEIGLAQALAGHPRIGDRVSGHDGAWSRREQAGVAGAEGEVRTK